MSWRDADDAGADDVGWNDTAAARWPSLRDALRGAGLAIAVGVLIVLAGAGAVIALVVVSLGPSHRGGPGDGRHSRRLPVEITPVDDSPDGAVSIRASRLAGAGRAVIAVCAAEAESQSRGVSACDLAHRRQVPVHHGKVQVPFRPARSIRLPGGERVDCASEPGRCVVMVASIENYDRSGFAPLTFLPAPG